MLFTTANTNCRDVEQLQEDLIGNEVSAVSLLVNWGHAPGSAPDKLESSLLGVKHLEWKYFTWHERIYLIQQEHTCVLGGRNKSLWLIWQFKALHYQIFCFEEGYKHSVVYGDSTEQSWSAVKCLQISTQCMWRHSTTTGEPKNWKRSFIKAELLNDSDLFISLSTY